jgi:MinD-like ATPase involved in chromosome partitioning or flagellar assembly
LLTTAAGAELLADLALEQKCSRDHSAVVVDSPVGMPSDLVLLDGDPDASVVLVCRPDRTSLVEAAEALVWMNDRGLVNRRRITVVLNYGAGPTDRGSAAAAIALGIRCTAIHSLPRDRTLAPGRTIPSGHDLPARLRRPINRLCLDIWTHTQAPIPAPAGNSRSQEQV